MIFSRWIDQLFRHPSAARRSARGPSRRVVPRLEPLEDRVTPTGNTIYVTNLQDAPTPQQGTLRYALALNAADNGGDTIAFEPQLKGTITVSTPLAVTANVNIIGNYDPTTGTPLVTVSGGNAVQVFKINSGLSNVNYANLTIDDGLGNSGGGVYIGNGSAVSFNNVNILSNSANSGGGVFIGSGGNVIFANCSIDNNHASGPTGDQGGGLFIQDSSFVHIYNSELNGNTALKTGGAMYVSGNGTVQGNAKVDIDGIVNGTAIPGLTIYGQPNTQWVETPPQGINFIPGEILSGGVPICEVNNNQATQKAGAIFNNGTVQFNFDLATQYLSQALTQVILNTTSGSCGAIQSFNGTGGNPGGGTPADAELDINYTTLSYNHAAKSEGGIYAQGNLQITNSQVSNNSAGQNAAGIAFSGPVGANVATLTNVTVDQNSASGDTGGIDNYGNMVITSCTISGNIAGTEAGGIRNNAGTLWIINTTIGGSSTTTGNSANGTVNGSDDGGGVLVDSGTVHIINSTIANNISKNGRGGGIIVEAPLFPLPPVVLIMQNSIVAENVAASEQSGPDIYVFPVAPQDTYTLQYNLIGDGSALYSNGQYIAINNVAGNLVGPNLAGGGTGSPINPMLGPLQNNGGQLPNATYTMALLPGSPAIDHGNNALAVDNNGNTLTWDQRGKGFPRIINSVVDMGAYEYGVPITISPSSLPTAFVNQPYSQQITATGGSGNFTYSISSGNFPSWAHLSASGLLTGTPPNTVGSPFTFTVTATDTTTGATGNQTYTLIVDALLVLTLNPATLPTGIVGQAYPGNSIVGSGGSGTGYKLTETGTVPGLTFNAVGGSGSFNGVPTTPGAYPISLTLSDSVNGSITQNYTIYVYNPLTLSPAAGALPATAVGSPYTFGFAATGGSGNYTYSAFAAAGQTGLPAGLTFNTTTGLLTGAATTPGTFTFTVKVTDSANDTVSQAYSLLVEPAITISPSSVNQGEAGAAYTQTTSFSATGGSNGGTYTFSVTGGNTDGLTLQTTGPNSAVLTGTPTTPGTFTFTITAQDGKGATGSKTYTLTIIAGPTLTPRTIPGGMAGNPYATQVLTATGGTGPYTFPGTDPTSVDGLSITYNNANGTATINGGTPAAQGSYSFTITVTDSLGVSGSVMYTLTISPPITVSPSTLPWAAEFGPYSAALTAGGGAGGPYTFNEFTGAGQNGLPPGISFNNSTGQFSGAATVSSGSYTFTVGVTDGQGNTSNFVYTIYAEGPIVVSPSSLPTGTEGFIYTQGQPLTASGGNGGPYTLSLSGTLPAGMFYNPATRQLVGTPTEYGSFPLLVSATDSNGGTGQQPYTLLINFSLGNSGPAKFVTAVYNQLLDRSPDPAAAGWVTMLNNGTVTPSGLVAAVEAGPEYLSDEVNSIYEHYLGRPADPAGLAGWVSALENGTSIEQVTASIIASPEYFNDKGGNYSGFITGLYQDVLGRSPSAAELNNWLSAINLSIVRNGGTAATLAQLRYQMALGFLQSTEYRTDLLGGGGIWNGTLPVFPWTGYYPEFLNRGIDSAGLAGWLQALQAGTSDQSVLAAIFGSVEGYDYWSVNG